MRPSGRGLRGDGEGRRSAFGQAYPNPSRQNQVRPTHLSSSFLEEVLPLLHCSYSIRDCELRLYLSLRSDPTQNHQHERNGQRWIYHQSRSTCPVVSLWEFCILRVSPHGRRHLPLHGYDNQRPPLWKSKPHV